MENNSQIVSPREKNIPISRPPAQIHHCPECESSTVQTSHGELEIRVKVLAKAHHKCETPGCNHTRFLEIHYLLPRSKGGTNDPTNLTVRCSACQARIHAHGPSLMVKSQGAIYSGNGAKRKGDFDALALIRCVIQKRTIVGGHFHRPNKNQVMLCG